METKIKFSVKGQVGVICLTDPPLNLCHALKNLFAFTHQFFTRRGEPDTLAGFFQQSRIELSLQRAMWWWVCRKFLRETGPLQPCRWCWNFPIAPRSTPGTMTRNISRCSKSGKIIPPPTSWWSSRWLCEYRVFLTTVRRGISVGAKGQVSSDAAGPRVYADGRGVRTGRCPARCPMPACRRSPELKWKPASAPP